MKQNHKRHFVIKVGEVDFYDIHYALKRLLRRVNANGYDVEEIVNKLEEKFYLQKMKSFYDNRDEEYAFLNFDITRQVYCLNNTMGNAKFKTSFTQQEIDKIKEEQHTDLSEFKQIPVEELESEI